LNTTNFLIRLEKFVSDEKTGLFIKLWYCSKKTYKGQRNRQHKKRLLAFMN